MWDFPFDAILSRWRPNVISRRKVLLPGEYTVHMKHLPSSVQQFQFYLLRTCLIRQLFIQLINVYCDY